MTSTVLDRARPPAPGPQRPFVFPPFQVSCLDNGMRILAARQTQIPMVYLQLLLPAGARYHGPRQAGLSALTAALIDEGTARSTSLEIAQRAERLGGYVAAGSGRDIAFVESGLLAANLDDGLELLAEIASAASFPSDEFERLHSQTLAEILRREQLPSAVADDALHRLIFADSTYGTPLLGNRHTVEALGRDQVIDFYAHHSGPAGACLVAVGNLDPETIAERIATHFSSWTAKLPAKRSHQIAAAQFDSFSSVVIDRVGAAQTELRLGHEGLVRSNPDFATVSVLNAILGGKFTSRINLNLRERHGFTYGAHSAFSKRVAGGTFVVSTAVATESTGRAVEEILLELRRVSTEPVQEDELEDAKNYLIGSFPYTIQTISGLGSRLEELDTYDLPDSHFRDLPKELAAVDIDAVRRVAGKYLHPDRAVAVAVGPAAELEPTLSRLGPVRPL